MKEVDKIEWFGKDGRPFDELQAEAEKEFPIGQKVKGRKNIKESEYRPGEMYKRLDCEVEEGWTVVEYTKTLGPQPVPMVVVENPDKTKRATWLVHELRDLQK